MSTTSDEILNDFMENKNKEVLGEKIENIEEDDNFLPEKNKPLLSDNEERDSAVEEKLIPYLKHLLVTALTVPLFVGGIISGFYILMKLIPTAIEFFKRIMMLSA
jgi:hypothetical protein